jgi:DNA-binding NarL/FixJ family response regulator
VETDAEVQRVLDAIDALGAEGDPVTRARRLSQLLTDWPNAHSRVRRARQDAVLELKAGGMSVRGIAAELDISPARVQQIIQGETTSKTNAKAKGDEVST